MVQHLGIAAIICSSLFLTACTTSSIGSTAGAVSGIASSAATANPLIGYSIGVTVQAATDATVKYVLRTWTKEQHELIAALAGPLSVGQSQQWQVQRVIPYGNERGRVEVLRDIINPLLVAALSAAQLISYRVAAPNAVTTHVLIRVSRGDSYLASSDVVMRVKS